MTQHVTPALLDAVVELSRQAGDKIMQVYGKDDFSVEAKSDQSPLTEADMASHHLIVDTLAELTPEIPILSEESADTITWEQRRAWPAFWLVDPLVQIFYFFEVITKIFLTDIIKHHRENTRPHNFCRGF